MDDQLPTPTEADGAALFEAQERGRAEMCVVDEAEIRSIGFTAVGRGEGIAPFPQARAGFDDSVVVSAGERLVARGLARAERTDRWAVQASGPLLAWFVGHVLPGNGSVVVNVERTPAAGRGRRRVTVVGRSGITLVEYLDVPSTAGDAPLPVRIDAVRRDVLVEELVDEVFRPLPAGTGHRLTLDLVTTAAHGPARVVADHETVGIETRGHGLRRSSTRLRKTDPVGFRNYLGGMLDELGS